MVMHFTVIVEVHQEDENPMTLPPCGIFSTIEKAREYIKETFEEPVLAEEWDERFQGEMHRSKEFSGTWEEIYIWGRELDER